MTRRWFSSFFPLSLSILMILAAFSVCFSEDFSVFELTQGPFVGAFPQINERGVVAWEGTLETDPDHWEIYVYDGSGVVQLTDNELYDCNVRINNNGLVVWQTLEDSIGHLFLYDGTEIVQITTADAYRILGDVNDHGDTVWTECDPLVDGSCDVFLYDGTTILQLTNNSYNDFGPRINNSGQVVWRGTDDTGSDIFLYDGSTTTRLTNDPLGDWSPQINEGGSVAWHRSGDPVGTQLFLFDGTDIVEIADSDVWKTCKLNDNGHLAWTGSDMSFYNGTQIVAIPYYEYWVHPPSYFDLNDNDYVVFPSYTGGSGRQIRVWDGVDVTFLSDSALDSDFPDMNNGNQIVWHSFPSFGFLDGEIFLAVPTNCNDIDQDGYGSPASPVCTHAQWDCDDSNPNLFPISANTYCDCEMPYPLGTAEDCSGGMDEDCDGFIDCEDEDCLRVPECVLPCGGCTPSAEASVRAGGTVVRSDALAQVAVFFIPVAQILLLKRLLRRGKPCVFTLFDTGRPSRKRRTRSRV